MQSGESSIQEDHKQVRRNQLKLIAIFGVALVPLLLAAVMYYAGWGVPDSKTNKGDLIWPPVSLLDEAGGADTQAFSEHIREDKKWQMIVTGPEDCLETCQEYLHMVRQVNVAMGREADRVGRMLLLHKLDAQKLDALRQTYPRLAVRSIGAKSWGAFYSNVRSKLPSSVLIQDEWAVWLVDPLGNVILHYGPGHDGYDMKDDLKRLLKLSNIG